MLCYSLFVLFDDRRRATSPRKPFEPVAGQAGKDVVWVPSPPDMVNKMMEIGQVTPNDFVIDLGSGDGRNVIAAAKLGASALGVEYNPDMVALSRRLAQEAGVADKAQFVEADMYEYDISKATVMALFLLPVNMNRLAPKFFNLAPGLAHRRQHVRHRRLGARRARDAAAGIRSARAGARRCCGSCRPRSPAPGRCRTAR